MKKYISKNTLLYYTDTYKYLFSFVGLFTLGVVALVFLIKSFENMESLQEPIPPICILYISILLFSFVLLPLRRGLNAVKTLFSIINCKYTTKIFSKYETVQINDTYYIIFEDEKKLAVNEEYFQYYKRYKNISFVLYEIANYRLYFDLNDFTVNKTENE